MLQSCMIMHDDDANKQSMEWHAIFRGGHNKQVNIFLHYDHSSV
jgi:hypothetical protein